MHTSTDRRDFLQQGAATLILGFPFAAGCAKEAADPEKLPEPRPAFGGLLGKAAGRMRDECKPGVVIVVPQDPAKALPLLQELTAFLGDHSAANRRLLGQAVFVCLPFKDARAAFPAMKSDSLLLLLDHRGQLIDERAADPRPFPDAAAHLTRFLHGPDRKHLAAFRDAQRAALGAAPCERIDAALRDLRADGFRTREDATRRLWDYAPRATAVLADAFYAGTEDVRHRIDMLFARLHAGATENASPNMPFGVEWFNQPIDPCPGCGRVAFNSGIRAGMKALRWKDK